MITNGSNLPLTLTIIIEKSVPLHFACSMCVQHYWKSLFIKGGRSEFWIQVKYSDKQFIICHEFPPFTITRAEHGPLLVLIVINCKFTWSVWSPFLSLRSATSASSLLVLTRVFFSLVPLTSTGTMILCTDKSSGVLTDLARKLTIWAVSAFISFDSCFIHWKETANKIWNKVMKTSIGIHEKLAFVYYLNPYNVIPLLRRWTDSFPTVFHPVAGISTKIPPIGSQPVTMVSVQDININLTTELCW